MTDILIVDDDKELADLLTDFLREEGYTGSNADSGERVVQLFERYSARLVVSDITKAASEDFTNFELTLVVKMS